IKPIIYTGAIGSIPDKAKPKNHAQAGMVVLRIGGKTYRIGVGGGAASSMDAGANKENLDFASVQRGEPMVARSAYNVIEKCVLLLDKNPIESIHDQGAGGASNMLTELVYPAGATLNMKNMRIADLSMSQLEAWVAESQELHGILIRPENLEFFQSICDEYECPYEVLGTIDDSGKVRVVDERDSSVPVDLKLADILGDLPQKTFTDNTVSRKFEKFAIPNLPLEDLFWKVANLTGVCLPTYMVNTFDGSVGGRVVQGPRDGEHMLPVNQFGILSNGFRGTEGTVVTYATSNPIAMQIDEQASARMVVSNLLTTLMFAHIPGGIPMIGGRLNEMWAFRQPGGKARLYNAIESITDTMKSIGLGINGGKDSTSMSTSFDDMTIKSFDTLIYKGEARMSDFRNYVTPSVKHTGSSLVFIDLANRDMRMGGSALAEAFGQSGNIVPDFKHENVYAHFERCFTMIQKCLTQRVITSGISREKGGLITAIAKMFVSASNKNARIILPDDLDHTKIREFLFNEESGIVVETNNLFRFMRIAKKFKLNAYTIGEVIKGPGNEIEISHKGRSISTICLDRVLTSMSREIEDKICGVPSELLRREESITLPITDGFILKHNPDEKVIQKSGRKYRVAVLSAPGTNGERELSWMFGSLGRQGFEVVNIPIKKIKDGVVSLVDFDIIAFAGGFSYGDVLGSGKGWSSIILHNEILREEFKNFLKRPDTLSFGVCNGFQVGTQLGIFDEDFLSINPLSKPRLTHNDSGRFEHRPVGLLIPENTNSIMFKGLGGSVLPAWSAHAEGKLTLGNESNYEQIMSLGLVAVHYADENGENTSEYPMCPNGSPHGIAGLTTLDGRHTFIMPHIERVIASNHHLPYLPQDWKKFKKSIWLRAVENMYLWLEENKK
ncbi:MAG: phosphoribosylformylglycinamidine synthase subunit PurQ, partial [Candidatus Pacebacteria bacterium]|nr:phosphoribosylformylglycinamidine synthase subunit PurQ [Candidatus Paceibacterota bacterium]